MQEHTKNVDSDAFAQEVIQRSREVPVVVDFWAAWCGPCRVLGPILEGLAGEGQGTFQLVKVDVDRNPDLASRFGVQGIPTVVGFRDGEPVARFTGALPEPAVRQWLDELRPTEADSQVELARDAIIEGDLATAEAQFREALGNDARHQEAGTGLGALLISQGRAQEALTILEQLSPTPEVQKLQATARLAGDRGDMSNLEERLRSDPDNPDIRLRLGKGLAARGEYEPALDHFLEVVRLGEEHRDEARKAILDIFEVLGNDHPLTTSYRRRLANELF